MKIYGICLIVLVLTNFLSGQEVQPIAIVVYDSAQVPSKDLLQAEVQVERILNRAGIHTEWVHCIVTAQLQPDDCTQAFKALHVRVNILAKARAGFRLTDSTFGYAMTDPDTIGPACYVFYDRILDLPESWEIRKSAILGLVVSHELGHLLLGSNSHSAAGIMSANLDKKKIIAGTVGRLDFNPEQASKMRSAIIRAAHNLQYSFLTPKDASENAVTVKPDGSKEVWPLQLLFDPVVHTDATAIRPPS